jgi:hypothetical protein
MALAHNIASKLPHTRSEVQLVTDVWTKFTARPKFSCHHKIIRLTTLVEYIRRQGMEARYFCMPFSRHYVASSSLLHHTVEASTALCNFPRINSIRLEDTILNAYLQTEHGRTVYTRILYEIYRSYGCRHAYNWYERGSVVIIRGVRKRLRALRGYGT